MRLLLAAADHDRARCGAGIFREQAKGGEEDIGPLQRAQGADEEEIGGVGQGGNRLELLGPETVGDDACRCARAADLGSVGVGLVLADEDEAVGHAAERPLGQEIDAAGRRRRVEMQAAAVGRVEAGYAVTSCPQEGADGACIGAAFGAVAMHDIGSKRPHLAGDTPGGGEIGGRHLAAHGRADEAEREERPQLFEQLVIDAAAGRGFAHHADRMPGVVLGLGQIADVAKETADRLAEAVNDPHGRRPVRRSSEVALTHIDGVAGLDRIAERQHGGADLSVDAARDLHGMCVGARREAAGDRHGLLHGHAGNVGILAGGGDFAHGEERPVADDLDRDVGMADIALAQPVGDVALDLDGRAAAHRHRADERHGQVACLIDHIGVRQIGLAEDDDAHLIAGIEMVGGDQFGVIAVLDGRRAGAAGEQGKADQQGNESKEAHEPALT